MNLPDKGKTVEAEAQTRESSKNYVSGSSWSSVRELNKGLETRNVHLYSPIPNLIMDMLLCTFLHIMMMIIISTALLRNLVPVGAGL